MSLIRRFKVLQTFPVWRHSDQHTNGASSPQKWNGQMKLGEVFAVTEADFAQWEKVGGAFCRTDLPRDAVPDFSGARLAYLAKHKFIEEVS